MASLERALLFVMLTVILASLFVPALESATTENGKNENLQDSRAQYETGAHLGVSDAQLGFSESSTPPIVQWNDTYGGTEGENARALVQTADGGYALAGYKAASGFYDAWLVKTDAGGNLEWDKTFGGKYLEQIFSMIQTYDGGFAMAGTSNSYDPYGRSDFYLVKTDWLGNLQWNKTYGGLSTHETAWSMVQTSDGGYALAGFTYPGVGDKQIYFVKTDSSGQMQWNRTYLGVDDNMVYSMIQTDDGGYALTGYSWIHSLSRPEVFLIKTDSAGDITWSWWYETGGRCQANSLVQTDDGGYAMAGLNWSGGIYAYLAKTDAAGNMQWSKNYGEDDINNYSASASSLVKTTDGGYALAGYTRFAHEGVSQSDLYLVKTNSTGDMQWNVTYGGTGDDYAQALVQTTDGGYALAGVTSSFGAGGGDFWLVKVGPPTPPTVAASFRFPLDGDWAVSRRFGKWYDDFQGYHLGEDVLRDFEAPVYAPANGIVKWNGNLSQYGYVLVIEHELADGSFVCSVLGHLRRDSLVSVGSTVTKGQVVGYLSSLPEENGGYNFTHLHFGIRKGIYSTELDRDGKWRYRGYGPADIVDHWYPPSQFMNYYNIQKTPTLPEEEGLRVTITSDKTFYQLGETIHFNVTVTNPTNETGINIIAHNSSLTIEPPTEIELENPQTFYDLGDLDPGESRTLNFTAIATKAGTMLKTWARAAGEDLQLGLSMIGAYLKQLSIGYTIPTEWSFAVITDLHIGRSGCSEEVEGRLQQAVSAINALRTDGVNITFVLVLGDITDAGGVNDFYEAQRILNRLNDPNQDGDTSEGIPYIPLIGNHDVKSDMEWCFDFVFWSAGNGNNWDNRHLIDTKLMNFERQDRDESYYQNYYFSYDGLDFLCLDVAGTVRDLEDSPATQYPEQTRQFVQHYFDMNRWESFVVASHFPLYEWGGFWGQDALEQDITSYSCNVTNLAGHTHRNYETWWSDRFRVIETEAVCQVEYSVPKDFPEPVVTGGTIRIVNVKNGEIDDYSILKNPEKVLEEHRELWRYRAYLTVEGFGSYIQPNKLAVFKAYCPTHHGFETSFQWAFGDGDYGSSITVSHSYLQEGDYNVTVNITKRNLFTNETTTTTIVRSLCVRTKHIISVLPPESFATSFPLPVDLTETPTNMYCQALIGENDTEGEKPVAIIGLHFENANSDIDLSNLLIDTDTATRKSIVFSASWPAEADCDKWLFVPSSGAGSVYICLNATNLNDVKLENADFVVNDGETVNNITVTTAYYGGKEYYLVYGNVTSFGGGEIFHDVTAEDASLFKTIVGQGYTLDVKLTIQNHGTFIEDFDVTLYANATLISTQAIVLTSQSSTTITFTWNTSGMAYGNYSMNVYAWPVLNETDVEDNNCTGGWIVVTIPGDVVGPYFEVDIYDITAICVCYDSKPGEPLYYPNCDLDGNGIIDIFDVTTACITYGQKYP